MVCGIIIEMTFDSEQIRYYSLSIVTIISFIKIPIHELRDNLSSYIFFLLVLNCYRISLIEGKNINGEVKFNFNETKVGEIARIFL